MCGGFQDSKSPSRHEHSEQGTQGKDGMWTQRDGHGVAGRPLHIA